MAKLTIENQQILTLDDETVLDALLRTGITIPYSCRQGGCFSCVIYSLDSKPPEDAQENLSDELKDKNGFFACQCVLEQDMSISLQ